MKFNGLLISALVLLALAGGLYWSNHHKPAETPATTDTPPKILSFSEADVTKIDIKKKSGDEVVLARNAAGKWEMTAPQKLAVDQDAIASMMSTLSSLTSDRLVDDKANNLGQYGLVEPAIKVGITKKDGKTTDLLIGDDTPTGSGAFAKLENDPRVFTLATFAKTAIDKGPKDLRDKRLMTFDSDKISRLELNVQSKGKAQDIEFGRDKDSWQILKPKPYRADGSQVDELTRKLKDAKMDTAASEEDAKKAAASFASGTPVATVKVTDPTGTQELQVRKNKDDYFAKSSIVDGAYKVAADLGTTVDKTVDDFRNKKLFDFGFTDPTKMEIRDGSKTYLITKSGENWMSNGKTMDPMSVQSLIDKLRDLSASKFVDSGFTTSVIDLTVTSNGNNRVEKVAISKNGDKYVGKRENEPSLYELESKTVDDLQKAASDVKPSGPPKK